MANASNPNNLQPRQLIKFYKEGWRYGRLIEIGTRWAYALHLGRRIKLPIHEIIPYD